MVKSKSVLPLSLLLLTLAYSVPLPSLGSKCTGDVARQCQGAAATREVPGLKPTAQCVTRSRRGKEPLHLSDWARLLAPVSGGKVKVTRAGTQFEQTQIPA